MTIGKRSLVVGSLIVVASVLYGAAKYYSPSLVFLVEQSLIQKAPSQVDRALLHERLRAQIAEAPDKDSQMQTLFRISEYVEKVQYLTLEQLDQLLPVQNRGGADSHSRAVR